MKIGILTNPIGHNYGGILQNWALQHVLKQLGHKPVTLYKSFVIDWTSYFRACIGCVRRRLMGQTVKFPDFPTRTDPQYAGLWKFIKKGIRLSKRLDKNTLFPYAKSKFGAVIVGSDQVWRPRYITYIEQMFLPYPKDGHKKIAYATSFGIDGWEFTPAQTARCRDLLSDFDAVSVRELSGIGLCKRHLQYDNAVLALDPTLLIDRAEYIKLCSDVPASSTGHVFAYILDENKALVSKAKTLADRLGVPFKSLSADASINAEDTIEDWLASFRDALYIVTDSYHGTIFSLIFKKPFAAVFNPQRGSARLSSLISLIPELKGRLVSEEGELPTAELDYQTVDSRLNPLKVSSIDFLRQALS